ncbi:MopE-related protein [Thermodesulfobacteriota bacterium]
MNMQKLTIGVVISIIVLCFGIVPAGAGKPPACVPTADNELGCDCFDGVDNDCDRKIDERDKDCRNQTCTTCTDTDGDGYAVEGGTCGAVDCDDSDGQVNPGAAEVCDDGIDNNCDGQIDEGCGGSGTAPEENGPHTVTRHSESITARDGGTISTFVYTTSAAGDRPVIVFRHGFNRSKDTMDSFGNHWATRGFVVILNDARTGMSPDYWGKDSEDMIDCANWAVQKNAEAGHYLNGRINPAKIAIGGYSAGGYTAEIAIYKNLAEGDGTFSCALMVLYDPVPTNVQDADTIAQSIYVPAVMLYGNDGSCNSSGAGKGIYLNTAGPTYAIYIVGGDHCDFEGTATFGCGFICGGNGWDSAHNTPVKRYGTAMMEAYLNCDASAYPYINGSTATNDATIDIYPESRDLDMPPADCP